MTGVSNDMIHWVESGTTVNGGTWSFGFWSTVSTAGTPTDANMATALNTAKTPLEAFWTSFKVYAAAGTNLTRHSAYFYPAGAALAANVAHIDITPVPGTGSTPTSPRSAVVVTTLTASSGRSHRGRMYLPFTGTASSSGLQISTSVVDNIASYAKTLLNAFNLIDLTPTWGNAPCWIRSLKTGQAYPVTHVRVDSKIDNQLRRQDKTTTLYSKTETL